MSTVARGVISTPRIILGTMTFGGQTPKADVVEIIEAFTTKYPSLVGPTPEIDTARMYVNGETERLLGEIIAEAPPSKGLSVASKANPFFKESLSTAGLASQLDASLAALQMEQIDIFYLHAPDAHVDIEETLEAVQEAFAAGKFKRFALSNFAAWEVVWVHGFMKAKHWVVPSIYQGMLNGITRKALEELLPALRRCGMSFYAYNPLAGGLLTGKHNRDAATTKKKTTEKSNLPAGGRFTGDTYTGRMYQGRFMQEEQFLALDVVLEACGAAATAAASTAEGTPPPPPPPPPPAAAAAAERGIDDAVAAVSADVGGGAEGGAEVGVEGGSGGGRSALPLDPAEAALRWCAHHSGLDAKYGDGIIVGASSVSQFEANMASLSKGPLPAHVVSAFDQAWKVCRQVSPRYERGVSGSALPPPSL